MRCEKDETRLMVAYSDVEFVFPRRSQEQDPRKIYANKRLLLRYDYFEAMFEGGFGEGEGELQGLVSG